MKIAYETTIDEATDIAIRMARLTGNLSMRSHMWIGLAMAPVIVVALVFLIQDPLAKWFLGGTTTILYILYWLSNYRSIALKQFRKQIRKALVKALGTDKPMPCEYEMDDTGLAYRKAGQEIRFEWSHVAAIKENEGDIEITMVPAGIAVIPKRIFETPDQQKDWVSFIREHASREKLAQSA